jgi:hypothetical protein
MPFRGMARQNDTCDRPFGGNRILACVRYRPDKMRARPYNNLVHGPVSGALRDTILEEFHERHP